VPGFRRWLADKAEAIGRSPKLAPFAAALAKLDDPQWMLPQNIQNESLHADLEQHLAPLCAYYLLHAKQHREPLDPVARFHLKNGARLERINWLGDTSAAGLQRSAGFSANYVYKLQDVERNHEFYVGEHKIRASREIEALAKRFVPPPRF
jgi:malonyl-CoA decarboxylase